MLLVVLMTIPDFHINLYLLIHKFLRFLRNRHNYACLEFANGSIVNMKLSKTQSLKIGQPGRFLCRLLGPLLKTFVYLQ